MDFSFMICSHTFIDIFFLTFSLWLGVFVVTRSHQGRISWLAAAALWSLSCTFLINLFLLYSPELIKNEPWFWGWNNAVTVSVLFHLSVSFLPKEQTYKKQWLISLIYVIAINLIAMDTYTPLIFARTELPGVSDVASQVGPFYPVFIGFLIIVPLLAFFNLYQGYHGSKRLLVRERFLILIWACICVLVGALCGGLSTWLTPGLPWIVSDIFFGSSVILIGYGVARWNALIEGRSVKLDLIYTGIAYSCVVGIYLVAAWFSNLIFGLPLLSFLVFIVLATITHSFYDWARSILARRIYGDLRYRELRENLRDMSRSMPTGQELDERLGILLQIICRTFNALNGFVALARDNDFNIIVEIGKNFKLDSLELDLINTGEITYFPSSGETTNMLKGAVSMPLRFGGDQIGFVLIGERHEGAQYSDEDKILLEDLAEIVAAVIYTANVQDVNTKQIEQLFGEIKQRDAQLQNRLRNALGVDLEPILLFEGNDIEVAALVEDALRHIHDFSYLGSQPLAGLKLLEDHLVVEEGEIVTHVDRGKALKETLVKAIKKLMPSADCLHTPPSREWYPYIILHDSYLLGKLNREIMGELYISEGTFNRTRRRALQSVIRILKEMEKAAHVGKAKGFDQK